MNKLLDSLNDKVDRVATVREKVWHIIFFQVREKSGNFDISLENLEKKIGKVREFQNFPLNGMAKAVF